MILCTTPFWFRRQFLHFVRVYKCHYYSTKTKWVKGQMERRGKVTASTLQVCAVLNTKV